MGTEPRKIEEIFIQHRLSTALDELRDELNWLEVQLKQGISDKKLVYSIEDRIEFLEENKIDIDKEKKRFKLLIENRDQWPLH